MRPYGPHTPYPLLGGLSGSYFVRTRETRKRDTDPFGICFFI